MREEITAQQAENDKKKEEEMKLRKETMQNMMNRENKNDKNEFILNLDDPDYKRILFMHHETGSHPTFKVGYSFFLLQ